MNNKTNIPHLPLTPTECWDMCEYIILQAEIHESFEFGLDRAREAKNGGGLLLFVTKYCGWLYKDNIFEVKRLPDPKYLKNFWLLDASFCTNLETIEAMDSLEVLNVYDCTNLKLN